MLQPVIYEYRTGIEIPHLYQSSAVGGSSLIQPIFSPRKVRAVLTAEVIPATRARAGDRNHPEINVWSMEKSESLVILESAGPASDESEIRQAHRNVANTLREKLNPTYRQLIEAETASDSPEGRRVRETSWGTHIAFVARRGAFEAKPGPRPVLTIVVTTIVGLLIGMLSALFLDSLARFRSTTNV
jgi:hypothetical protein